MQDKPLPHEDQLITMVSVREGDIYVTPARVLVAKPNTIALYLETEVSEPPPSDRAQPLTLLYTGDNRVLRLKAVVRERIDGHRITVEPVGDVKEGDRRDYRRGDVDVHAVAHVVEGDAAAARAVQVANPIPLDDPSLVAQSVNLSGSGMQIVVPGTPKVGALMDLRMVLPAPKPTMVTLIGQVVRAVPASEGEGTEIALHFAEIAESDQDLVVYSVFAKVFDAGDLDGLDLEV